MLLRGTSVSTIMMIALLDEVHTGVEMVGGLAVSAQGAGSAAVLAQLRGGKLPTASWNELARRRHIVTSKRDVEIRTATCDREAGGCRCDGSVEERSERQCLPIELHSVAILDKACMRALRSALEAIHCPGILSFRRVIQIPRFGCEASRR